MAKTTKIETEITNQEVKSAATTEIETEKPYSFRKLSSKDVFLMFKIISLIGINEFMACLKSDSLKNVVKMFTDKEAGEDQEAPENQDDIFMMGAIAGTLEIANVIMSNLPKCEKEIYQLLASTSNLTIEEISAEGNAVMFVEMVIDFIKKDEFPDFIKVVSKLFK